jgi:hypothetical protein
VSITRRVLGSNASCGQVSSMVGKCERDLSLKCIHIIVTTVKELGLKFQFFEDVHFSSFRMIVRCDMFIVVAILTLCI